MSPSISKADAAMLGRRRQQPTKAPGELLAVFVAGKLRNPLNSLRHWRAESRYRTEWHERVATVIWETEYQGRPKGWRLFSDERFENNAAKVVTFLAHTGGRMDGDGLQASLKPVRDALVECGVLSGDADKDGHVFHYAQRIDRACRGVEIRVSLAGKLTP